MKKFKLILSLLFIFFIISCQKTMVEDYNNLIEIGEFDKAQKNIEERLVSNAKLSSLEKKKLLFEIERMDRIRKDFTKTEQDVIAYIKKYIPDVNKVDLKRWEDEKSLETLVIDGEKKYFNRAARNLFRLNEECKKIWSEKHPYNNGRKTFNLDEHNRAIIKTVREERTQYAKPVRMEIKYTIDVKPNSVPDGEIVRCWIPFPREIPQRQTDIKIIKTLPAKYRLAPQSNLQRTIYFEQIARKDSSVRFEVEYAYTSFGVYTHIDPQDMVSVRAYEPLSTYLKEEPPHIVFDDALKSLSAQIVSDEENPYRIAQKLFAWIDKNIPWASAREYSTIRNIPLYAYKNKHGDCGIQTLLFITLCRLNGIPARWQSGWRFKPPSDSMHDWGMIYFEPYGWLPMDVTYGLRSTDDEDYKWFYLHGMDSYRLIFNDAFGRPFTPAKEHFRSETVDSQRGEVEWRGGNLYFDQWDWNMEWREVAGK